MNKPEIKLGAAVKSKAGRDTGRTFIVVELVDFEYVLVSDGRTHKMEKPKKKKLKHLKLVSEPTAEIAARLIGDPKPENHEVRKWLACMTGIKEE